VTDVRYPSDIPYGHLPAGNDGTGAHSGVYQVDDASGGYPVYDGGYGTGGYSTDGYTTGGYSADNYADTSGTWQTPSYDTYGYGSGTYEVPAFGGVQDSGTYPQAVVAPDTSGAWQTPSYDNYGTDSYGTDTYATGQYAYGGVQDSGFYAAPQTETYPAYTDSYDSGFQTAVQAPAPQPDWSAQTHLNEPTWHTTEDGWNNNNRVDVDMFDTGYDAPTDPKHDESVAEPTDNGVDTPPPGGRRSRKDKDKKDKSEKPGSVEKAPKPEKTRLRATGAPIAVMGVAAMAVAAVGGMQAMDTGPDSTVSAADGQEVPLAVSSLDQQLTDVREGAEDLADRASRTQTRISLMERQEEVQRAQEEEQKRREALRPKYVLPVAQTGLSAVFGQSGNRWSSNHTGIDFPVDYGTSVRAITDGVVRTEYDRFYGNMVIVTAKDGTETWYCHLSRYKVRSGPVKAGDTVAYSGNSGNSTGPHLHIEVRPDGGSPIDPIPWLKARGLNPRG
jgi:murein DD-endopeptidase MepM/ murein hydrolase activator NlpD